MTPQAIFTYPAVPEKQGIGTEKPVVTKCFYNRNAFGAGGVVDGG
jgi:hypothetical protein